MGVVKRAKIVLKVLFCSFNEKKIEKKDQHSEYKSYSFLINFSKKKITLKLKIKKN